MSRVTEIAEAVAEIRRLWAECCKHDGIEPGSDAGSLFVCFSDENPHVPAYNEAMQRYYRLRFPGAFPGSEVTE